MQYVFANYPTGKRTLRIGNDKLEIHEGQAEVDQLNPAQVTLAEIYGGKPILTTLKTVNEAQPASPIMGREQHRFVKTIIRQKGILRVALGILNSQVKGGRPGNGSK